MAPIEGGLTDEIPYPPAALAAALDEVLGESELTIGTLTLLININKTFLLPAEQLDRAVELIRA
jgi:hypothetical protein